MGERDRLVAGITAAGWSIPEPQGNFVWFDLGERTADLAATFGDAGLAVRPFAGEGLRISVGEPEATDRLVELLHGIAAARLIDRVPPDRYGWADLTDVSRSSGARRVPQPARLVPRPERHDALVRRRVLDRPRPARHRSGAVPGSEPTLVQPSTPDADPAARAAARLAGGCRPPVRRPDRRPGRRRVRPGRRTAPYRNRRSPVAPGSGWSRPGFPPPSSGGGNKGLLIILAVVGAIVLIAILAVGSWAVFLRDSDDSDSGNGDGGDDSSLPDTSPEEVVEDVRRGRQGRRLRSRDRAASARSFIAEEDANCEDEEDFMDDGEFEYEIGDATIDEDAGTASVPVTADRRGLRRRGRCRSGW